MARQYKRRNGTGKRASVPTGTGTGALRKRYYNLDRRRRAFLEWMQGNSLRIERL